jgi:glycosyltransferase involved in cell wall biosynthesis
MAATLQGRRLEEGPKGMRDQAPLTVSVIIKALNEEQHIAAAIESALTAIEGIEGEVILADSASTDRTVEIARRYPIKIVRMANIQDRSCGAGAQLGFQYSRGRYVWLVDGDMRVKSGFLATAIQFLEEHPAIAGVGGMLSEHETSNLEYVKRNVQEYSMRRPGLVTRLDGGGVYRRSAIETVGYLTDRNLHGAEELELGARLVARGWKLVRLPLPDVDHYGHSGSAYWLLLRRLMTGVSTANGEVLRAAIGAYHLPVIVQKQKRMLILLALIYAWWLCLLAAPALVGDWWKATPVFVALALFPIVVMSLRSRSISLGLYSVVAWQIHAIGFWPGFLRRRIPPTDWIASTVIENQADVNHQTRGELSSTAGQRATPPG